MGAGPLILSWINEICSGDTEKRALLVAMANDLAYVVQAVVSTWRERREGPKKIGADMKHARRRTLYGRRPSFRQLTRDTRGLPCCRVC